MLNQHSKKHHHAGPPNIVPDSLVDPGNPSHRYQARSTAHLDRPCSRMVALAASSPGRRTPRSPQTKNVTVMLRFRHESRPHPEERARGGRLEGWPQGNHPPASFSNAIALPLAGRGRIASQMRLTRLEAVAR